MLDYLLTGTAGFVVGAIAMHGYDAYSRRVDRDRFNDSYDPVSAARDSIMSSIQKFLRRKHAKGPPPLVIRDARVSFPHLVPGTKLSEAPKFHTGGIVSKEGTEEFQRRLQEYRDRAGEVVLPLADAEKMRDEFRRRYPDYPHLGYVMPVEASNAARWPCPGDREHFGLPPVTGEPFEPRRPGFSPAHGAPYGAEVTSEQKQAFRLQGENVAAAMGLTFTDMGLTIIDDAQAEDFHERFMAAATGLGFEDNQAVALWQAIRRGHIVHGSEIPPIVATGSNVVETAPPNIGGLGHHAYKGPNYVTDEEIAEEMKGVVHTGTEDAQPLIVYSLTYEPGAVYTDGSIWAHNDGSGRLARATAGVVMIPKKYLDAAKHHGWELVEDRAIGDGSDFVFVRRDHAPSAG